LDGEATRNHDLNGLEPLPVERPAHVPDELRIDARRLEGAHLRNHRLVDERLRRVDPHAVEPLAQRARHLQRRPDTVVLEVVVGRASTPRDRVSRWANASYGPSMRSTVSHGAISSPSYSACTSSSGHSMLQSLRIAIASSMPPRNAWALPNTCIVTHGRWSSLSSSSRVRTKYLSE